METSEPTLRVATRADAHAIERLMKASAAGLFPAYYDERQVEAGIHHVAQLDPMLLADRTYFVIEADAELVACGGWSRRSRPYTGSGDFEADARILDPQTEAAHVRAMFTRPGWTRRGLGRRILAECEAAAGQEGYRRLDLLATLSGVPLYRACGFTPSGPEIEISLIDGTPMACLPMSKPIDARVPATVEQR
jgi:GNAT superfamily N-acetyltransferase